MITREERQQFEADVEHLRRRLRAATDDPGCPIAWDTVEKWLAGIVQQIETWRGKSAPELREGETMTTEELDTLLATAKPRRLIIFGGGESFRWENHSENRDFHGQPAACKLHDDVFCLLRGGSLKYGDEREYATEAAAMDALRAAVEKYKQTAPAAQPGGDV
jgi:hypothetical protein